MTDKNFSGYSKTQDALDEAKYDDNTPVQYQFTNKPILSVSDWENIPALTQANIIAKASLDDLVPDN